MSNGWQKAAVVGIAGLFIWELLGPEGREQVRTALRKAAEDTMRALQEQERQRKLALLRAAFQTPPRPALPGPPAQQTDLSLTLSKPLESMTPSKPPAVLMPDKPAASLEPDVEWQRVIVPPSVILIVGKRGSGKSALGYRQLELFRYRLKPYVVGVPNHARKVLPEWIGIAPTLQELPHGSIALVDEAYLLYHSRDSMAEQSKAMSQAINLSRHRDQTLIFVSQEARQMDRNVASSANVLVFKDLGILQLEFDRPELRKLVTKAKEEFSHVTGDLRPWAYVYSPDADFVGLIRAELPSFWKPELSRLFSMEQSQAKPRPAAILTPAEKAARAMELRTQGWSYSQIGDDLGVAKATVLNYLKGYPYRH